MYVTVTFASGQREVFEAAHVEVSERGLAIVADDDRDEQTVLRAPVVAGDFDH